MRPRRRALLFVLLALTLGLSACGGGGGGTETQKASDDPIDQAVTAGERSVQATGAGKVRLGGTLLVPPAVAAQPSGNGGGAATRVPAVLFVPTVGAGERNGPVVPGSTGLDPLAADLAKAFGDAGLASYRYDGRGTGESKLDPGTHLAFDDLVTDAKAGIDLLTQRKETAGRDVAVVAYDTGGLVALRLAATDPRVKRLVLISSPGRPLLDFQTATLSHQYGPESGEALRAAVGQLLATKSVPPAASLRTELRPLLPADQVPFLTELYSLDPLAEAGRVRAQAMVVAPSDAPAVEAMAPQLLAQALTGSELVLVDRVDSTLEITGPPPSDDRGDPASPNHEHGASSAQAKVERDTGTVGRISAWLSAAPRA